VRIRFTPTARKQFFSAIAYIYKENPKAAFEFKNKSEKTLSRLKTFPLSGRSIPEFPGLPFREVIIYPYRFFYRVVGKTVWIAAVWHGSQLPEEPD
jgi:toxin ParE1/3/4